MTHTKIIAVKLLGWVSDHRPLPSNTDRAYALPNTVQRCSVTRNVCVASSAHWPDFTHPRDCWYWVRKMEDALAEKGLLYAYSDTLMREYDAAHKGDGPLPGEAVMYLVATVEQRLAAAVKVLEQEGK